jgi:hypothetical protein
MGPSFFILLCAFIHNPNDLISKRTLERREISFRLTRLDKTAAVLLNFFQYVLLKVSFSRIAPQA